MMRMEEGDNDGNYGFQCLPDGVNSKPIIIVGTENTFAEKDSQSKKRDSRYEKDSSSQITCSPASLR